MMWLELGELEGCENSPMKRDSILSLGSLRLIYSLSLSLTADLLIIQILQFRASNLAHKCNSSESQPQPPFPIAQYYCIFLNIYTKPHHYLQLKNTLQKLNNYWSLKIRLEAVYFARFNQSGQMSVYSKNERGFAAQLFLRLPTTLHSTSLQFQQQINMPFQISPDAFKWLQTLSLTKDGKRNQNAMMEVSEETTSKLVDGHAIGLLLRSTAKGKEEAVIKKLEALKENSTPAIRLYNWGILTEVLKQMGYTLEYAEKSKLTNQDPEPLTRLFSFLCELRNKDPTIKGEPGDALKVEINEIGKKGPRDATNALQFLTILISKHFKISPQQTLNLFLDNNKYLSHLLAKGVKNSFEPIYGLLAEIKTHAEFVVLRLFCLDEEQNVNFAFNALRTCLIGKDEATAVLFCEVLMQIYHQYRLSNVNLQVLRNWVKNEGINTLFFSIKKQPLLMGSIIEICYSYLDDEFFKFIQLSQKSILWSTDREKLIFYKNFVVETSQEVLGKFMITNFFDEWNRMLLKSMKKTKDNYETILLIAIMEVQWNKLGTRFEQHDLGIANQFINFLKGVLAMEGQLLFVQSCRTLFSLMQSLGSVKNPFAPLIYKILITAYSSINDSSRIAFISDNFTESFKGISGLPGAALVQPLLKHLEKNLEYSVISLCQTLIGEKRISDDESLDLIEMFTKILFQDIRFGSVILEATFEGLPNISDELANSFLENNVKLSLAQLYSSSKAITKTIKALKEELTKIQDAEAKGKVAQNFVNASSKHIICKNLVGFIAKALLLDGSLKKQSQSAIFQTYIKIKVELKKAEQAELLRPVMASYYEDEQLEQKIAFYMDKLFPPKAKIQPPQKGHSHDHSDHNHNISKSVTLRPSTSEQEKQTAIILDPSLLKPSSFAIRDLQKLKQKRYDLKTIEQEKQKQKLIKAQKIQKFKTIQHEKRLIESMTTIKNDIEYNHLQALDTKGMSETIDMNSTSLNKQAKENKQMNAVGIKLINLQKQQEDTYRQDAESIMRKYRKVWRYLFYKYSSKKQDGGGEEKTHMGDAWKMLKDYDFSFLKKEECFTIARLINQNLKRKNDIQFLNYNGFQDFILQSAIIGYSKQGFTHIPPGQQLLLFIEQLKKITKEKSGSIEIFENPEEAYFQETEVIREFNKRLKDNPDYILPQGYKRIKQTTLEYEYDFHPMLQKNLGDSYIAAIQVLDWIFMKHPSFGFHIIEPLTIKSETYFAKPVLFQNLSLKMKDYKQGYLNPKRSISATGDEKDTFTLPSPPVKKQFKPYINFSLGIKLGIAETSLKNKSIAQEVAYCMEDILNAIENQSPVVRKGNKRRIVNEFMRRKKTEIAKVETERKKDEVNWKRRAQSVKLEVEALREKRKESEKQKKKKEYLDKKARKQREDKIYRQRLQEFEKVKAKIAEKKETLMELKAFEEQKLKKEKEQYKIGVEEYFRKKKDELKESEEQYKRKKNEQKQKKQQVEQKSKQFVKKLYLSNLKKEETVLEKIDEIKQAYEQTWKSEEIQNLFSQKKQSLKLLFDLLLKYEKSKISATNYDEIGVSTLNYFCLKFKVIPFMLQKQDVNKIYMYALKESQDKKRKGINFQKFQEVLFLISVKAKKILNKIVQKRKKKEKKMQAFLNAQKSGSGNHFEAQSVDQSSSQSSQSEDEGKPTLQDEYLFNAENVSEQTVDQVITFLRLPSDKASMEQRYKQAMETKTSKPRNQLIMQIKESLDEQ